MALFISWVLFLNNWIINNDVFLVLLHEVLFTLVVQIIFRVFIHDQVLNSSMLHLSCLLLVDLVLNAYFILLVHLNWMTINLFIWSIVFHISGTFLTVIITNQFVWFTDKTFMTTVLICCCLCHIETVILIVFGIGVECPAISKSRVACKLRAIVVLECHTRVF